MQPYIEKGHKNLLLMFSFSRIMLYTGSTSSDIWNRRIALNSDST